GLLHGIFCIGGIAQDRKGDPVQRRCVLIDQSLECLLFHVAASLVFKYPWRDLHQTCEYGLACAHTTARRRPWPKRSAAAASRLLTDLKASVRQSGLLRPLCRCPVSWPRALGPCRACPSLHRDRQDSAAPPSPTPSWTASPPAHCRGRSPAHRDSSDGKDQ